MADAASNAGAVTRLIGAIRTRLTRTEPSAAAEADDPAAELAYVLCDPVEEAKPRTLISLLGEPLDNVAEVIESVATACRLRGEYPIAVMSELRPDMIAASAVPIEFIPTFGHLPLGAEAYERYVRRRWSLLPAKWNSVRQIELGTSFDDFVAEQLARAKSTAAPAG